MKKTIKITTLLFSLFSFLIISMISFFDKNLPVDFSCDALNENVRINNLPVMMSLGENQNQKAVKTESNISESDNYNVTLKLFNIFPIKDARVRVEDRHYVIPGGQVFGIKLYTKGVVIVGMSEIETKDGRRNPAKDAGLEIGDIITEINRREITSNADISEIVSKSKGDKLTVTAVRDQKELNLSFNPVKSADGKYMAGLWVRDSTAGIGTLTFYDTKSGLFGGLGHAVCDTDTGGELPVNEKQSSIVPAGISGVEKGVPGNPGELLGHFSDGEISGSLLSNGDTGVYGLLDNRPSSSEKKLAVAFPEEIQIGDAKVLCTVSDGNPEYYDCKIERINYMGSKSQNMTVRITDKKLLNLTGGIVQGMSGSPLIQNGRLVGAVTHVFVNDPTRGYAIFAETMCKQADYVVSCHNNEAA